VGYHKVIVYHRSHVVKGQLFDLLYLMRRSETVKEVNEGDPRFKGCGLGNKREVHCLLHILRAEHSKTGSTRSHHIRMITEYRERLRGQGAGRHMKDRRRQFSSYLEHVRHN